MVTELSHFNLNVAFLDFYLRPARLLLHVFVRFALQEQYSSCGCSLFHPKSSHGFSDQLIENIMQHAPYINSAEYMQKHLYIFSSKHTMDVLEVFQELFEDIPNYEEQIEELNAIYCEVVQAEDHLLAASFASDMCDSDNSSEEFYQLQEFELLF